VKLQLGLAGSLERGAAAASIVCSRQGPQPPTAAEVDDLIAEKA
jgi:fructokinase